MQERYSRLRVWGGELARSGWGLEQVFVKIAFLLESFHAAAQLADRVADSVKFLGVHLDGFTRERSRAPPPFDGLGDDAEEQQRDDEFECAHFGDPLGDPWLLHRRGPRSFAMQDR